MADKFKKQEQESKGGLGSILNMFSKKTKVNSDYVELEGGDNAKQVENFEEYKDQQQDELLKNLKKNKKQKGQTCCMVFSVKTGFYLYGVIDIIELIFISIIYFYNVLPILTMTFLLFQLPNVVLFLLVVIQDDLLSRKIYAYVLMFKGFVQTFVFPIILLEIVTYFSNTWRPDGPDSKTFCQQWIEIIGVSNHKNMELNDIAVPSEELEIAASKMCKDTMLDIAVIAYMVLQLLAGYQIQLGQIYFNEKKQMEYANDKNRRLTEAQQKAKEINILKIRDNLKKIREQLKDQQIEYMRQGQSIKMTGQVSVVESGVEEPGPNFSIQ